MENTGGQEGSGRRRGEDDSGLTGEENDGEEVSGSKRLADLEGEGAEAGNSGCAHRFGSVEDEDAVAARFRIGHLKPWCGWWWLRE
jgi:hypothetical protein